MHGFTQAIRLVSAALLLASAFGCASHQELEVDRKTVRFEPLETGRHSVEAVGVRNTSGQPIHVTTRIDHDAAPFDASLSTCTDPLPIGDACVVFVTFSPNAAGDFRDRLCVRADDDAECLDLFGAAAPRGAIAFAFDEDAR